MKKEEVEETELGSFYGKRSSRTKKQAGQTRRRKTVYWCTL